MAGVLSTVCGYGLSVVVEGVDRYLCSYCRGRSGDAVVVCDMVVGSVCDMVSEYLFSPHPAPVQGYHGHLLEEVSAQAQKLQLIALPNYILDVRLLLLRKCGGASCLQRGRRPLPTWLGGSVNLLFVRLETGSMLLSRKSQQHYDATTAQ